MSSKVARRSAAGGAASLGDGLQSFRGPAAERRATLLDFILALPPKGRDAAPADYSGRATRRHTSRAEK